MQFSNRFPVTIVPLNWSSRYTACTEGQPSADPSVLRMFLKLSNATGACVRLGGAMLARCNATHMLPDITLPRWIHERPAYLRSKSNVTTHSGTQHTAEE